MKIIKRMILIVLGLGFLVILLFAGTIFYDSFFGHNTAEFSNITYTNANGEELLGYLALPDGPGPYPGILLIHEWWGLNEGITILAEALAAEGYVVFAPDAYRGEVTAVFPRALYLRLSTPEAQVFADVDSGLAYLRGLDEVDTERIASMGFCFGGGQSLQLGLRQSENLAMTILYYGAVVTDPELLRPLIEAQPVLGIFAEEDQQIFVEDVLEFEAAMNSLGIENQVTIYPGVGHGFINEHNFNQPGTAGDAWQEAITFLNDHFMNQ